MCSMNPRADAHSQPRGLQRVVTLLARLGARELERRERAAVRLAALLLGSCVAAERAANEPSRADETPDHEAEQDRSLEHGT